MQMQEEWGRHLRHGARAGDHMHLHGLLLKLDTLRGPFEPQQVGRHVKAQRMLHMPGPSSASLKLRKHTCGIATQ